MSLPINSAFCVIFVLSMQIDNCVTNFMFGCRYRSLSYWIPEVQAELVSTIRGCKDRSTPVLVEITEEASKAVYGDDIEAAFIENERALYDLFENFEKILATVVAEEMFNSFEDQVRFLRTLNQKTIHKTTEEYLRHPYDYFRRNYEDYTPEFFEDSGSLGLVYLVLTHVTDQYDIYKDNVYIATVYTGANQTYIDDQQQESDILTDRFQHNQLVGVFKYELNGEIGYAMFDPANGFVKLIHVKESQTQFTEYNPDLGFSRHRMLPYFVNGYQAPRSYMIEGQLRSDQDLKLLYYIKKPYCSAQRITAKENLLLPTRMLQKRNSLGKVVLEFSNKLLPIQRDPEFILLSETHHITHTYSANTITSIVQGRQNLTRDFQSVIDYMGEPAFDFMLEKVRRYVPVSRDFEFLELYSKLIVEKLGINYEKNETGLR